MELRAVGGKKLASIFFFTNKCSKKSILPVKINKTQTKENKKREKKKIVNEKIGCSVKTSAFDDGFFFLLKQVNNVYWLESNVDTNLLKYFCISISSITL